MGAEYPATCGMCGRYLPDEAFTRLHMGLCYLAHYPRTVHMNRNQEES